MDTQILPSAATSGKPRERVLIIAHHDGWLECFAERNVDVRIVTMPKMSTPRGEILAEQHLEHSLPECYRNLYWPDHLRASALLKPITPAQIAWNYFERAVIAAVSLDGERLKREAGRRVSA